MAKVDVDNRLPRLISKGSLAWLVKLLLVRGSIFGVMLGAIIGFQSPNVQAQGPPMYKVVDLGALAPNADSEAFSINNAGKVVGWIRVSGRKQAVEWRNVTAQPTLTHLWAASGGNSIAYGINDASDQAVGWGSTASPAGAVAFPSTPLTNVEARAYGVNNNIIAVGWSYLAGGSNQHAVVFNGGAAITGSSIGLPYDLGNFGTDNSRAYGVNDSLNIVGAAATASGPSHAFHHSGVSKLKQSTDDLGTFGGLQSEACCINSFDQVAGWADLKCRGAGGPVRHAFLWQGGQKQDLGDPYGALPKTIKDPMGTRRLVYWVRTLERAADGDGGKCINDRSVLDVPKPQIVGYSELHWLPRRVRRWNRSCIPTGAEFHRAFMYDGKMHDLNDLIPPQSGWYLLEAWGINDKGQIVGRGSINGSLHAFALLP